MKKKYLLRIFIGILLCSMFLLSPNSVQASSQKNFSQRQISQFDRAASGLFDLELYGASPER